MTVETKTDTVSIAQLGWGKAILLSRQVVTIEEIGGNFDLAVTTNVDYEIGLAEYEWIKEVTIKTRAHEVKTNRHQFIVEANDGNMRNAKIEIKDSDPNSALEPAILIVLQNKIGNYVPEDADVVEKDILVKATSVTGDGGCLSDHPYEGLIDGTQELFWHTVWAPSTTFPQYIEFTFEEKVDLDYFIYWNFIMENVWDAPLCNKRIMVVSIQKFVNGYVHTKICLPPVPNSWSLYTFVVKRQRLIYWTSLKNGDSLLRLIKNLRVMAE